MFSRVSFTAEVEDLGALILINVGFIFLPEKCYCQIRVPGIDKADRG